MQQTEGTRLDLRAASRIVGGAMIIGGTELLFLALVISGLQAAGLHKDAARAMGLVFACITSLVVLPLTGSWRRWLARPPTLRARLGEVRTSLAHVGSILGDLERDLAVRMQLLQERQEQLEEYEQVASLTPEQREAIERMVAAQFAKEGKKAVRRDLTFLTVGVLTGFLVNWASDPLWRWLT
ncbi:hypothetical protein [Micromonospora sp. NPDC005806]|uniref:hypothetical protein n=1 Tax=Micromonospora sp. NPDC005806 TaxID=3364234 RepID=UPI0036A419E1